MKSDIQIEFTCRPGGYSGEELESLNSPLWTEYRTVIGFQWQPAAQGVESWSLIVTMLTTIGSIAGSVIIKELCQDLYAWTKEQLLKVLQKKKTNVGSLQIRFSDSAVELWTEYPNDDMLVILNELPSLIRRIDPGISDSWEVYVKNAKAKIMPQFKGVEMKLFGEVETGRTEEVQAVIDRWSRQQLRRDQPIAHRLAEEVGKPNAEPRAPNVNGLAGEYGMDRECESGQNCLMKLTAAYKKVGDWWAAWVEEIPGVNTQGETLEQARENLKDALRMVLEANRELSEKEQEATRREDLVVA